MRLHFCTLLAGITSFESQLYPRNHVRMFLWWSHNYHPPSKLIAKSRINVKHDNTICLICQIEDKLKRKQPFLSANCVSNGEFLSSCRCSIAKTVYCKATKPHPRHAPIIAWSKVTNRCLNHRNHSGKSTFSAIAAIAQHAIRNSKKVIAHNRP